RGPPGFEPLSLNDVVADAVELKQYDFEAHKIAVETTLDPAIPVIRGDRSELRQVLVNVLHNADQALAGRGRGGKVTVVVRARAGAAEVEVRDDGPGIPEAALARIFDPFFTLASAGRGMGLGL